MLSVRRPQILIRQCECKPSSKPVLTKQLTHQSNKVGRRTAELIQGTSRDKGNIRNRRHVPPVSHNQRARIVEREHVKTGKGGLDVYCYLGGKNVARLADDCTQNRVVEYSVTRAHRHLPV